MGLKCPKEYLETVIGLTMGYWYPLNYPYFFTGPTKLFDKPINGGYPSIENRNLLPFGGAVFEYLFNDEDGRLKIPLLGWTWRNTLYFWGYIFAFAYLCYKKDKRGLALVIIPLLYMLSCLLGPVSWMRYIYPNIATVPIIVYLCTHAKNRKA